MASDIRRGSTIGDARLTSVLTQQEYFSTGLGSASHSARIEVQGVHKSFGTKSVLRNLDLVIEPGEFVAIVGRSGCGKSTLLRLVAGLDRPTSGTLRIDGAASGELRDDTRIMFQEARLLPWRRVDANVMLGLPATQRAHAEAVLAQV